MANFVYVYYKEKEDDKQLPMEEVMAAWKSWFGELGDKLVDGGGPFNDNGQYVQPKESGAIENYPASGYSIVKAGSMDEATEMAKGCPMLEHNSTATVRVYEVMPM